MFRSRSAPKLILFFTLLVLLGVILVVGYSALSAANSVPLTRLGLTTQSIIPSELIPVECNAITITNLIYCSGSGTCNGSNANDLIFGTSGVDRIQGKKGDDCILGGGANDDLNGDEGNDVCLGGPGSNTYTACEYSNP